MKSSSYHVGTLKPLAWQSAWCSWPRRWGSESSAVRVRKGAWETASVRAREKPRPWGRVRSYRPRRPAWSRWTRRCRRCHSRPCGRAWRGRPRRCRGSISSTAHIDVSPVWRQYYCKNVSSSFMSCSLFLLFTDQEGQYDKTILQYLSWFSWEVLYFLTHFTLLCKITSSEREKVFWLFKYFFFLNTSILLRYNNTLS